MEPTLPPHKFWDRENVLLFTGVGVFRALDFASTKNMLARGREEILLTNDVVRNNAAFTAIEVGATGTSIALSYWLHRTGHHKLERWLSIGPHRRHRLRRRPQLRPPDQALSPALARQALQPVPPLLAGRRSGYTVPDIALPAKAPYGTSARQNAYLTPRRSTVSGATYAGSLSRPQYSCRWSLF